MNLGVKGNILIPFSTVRPPPGFECKSPSGHHMPMLDDPSILWSKAIDAG